MQTPLAPSRCSSLAASGVPRHCPPAASPSTTPTPSSPTASIGADARRSDARLVEALLAHHDDAWRSFLGRFDRIICHSIRRATCRGPMLLTTDEERADIRASFLLSLFAHDSRKLRTFDSARGSLLSTWIAMLAERHAVDHVRALCTRARHRMSESESEGHAAIPSPEELMLQKQGIARMRDALATLAPRERELFDLYFEDDMPAAEIADRMGTSLQTVYSRRHKVELHLSRAVQADDRAHADAA